MSTDASDVETILDNIDLYEANSGHSVLVILALIINRNCITDTPVCAESTTTTTFNDALDILAQNRIDAD